MTDATRQPRPQANETPRQCGGTILDKIWFSWCRSVICVFPFIQTVLPLIATDFSTAQQAHRTAPCEMTILEVLQNTKTVIIINAQGCN